MKDEGSVLLIARDLVAIARVRAVAEALGRTLVTSSFSAAPRVLENLSPIMTLVDMDEVGAETIEASGKLISIRGGQVLGYYSHVNADLASAGAAVGWRVLPRGRLWRDLGTILHA